MKRILSFLLAAVLCLSCLSGAAGASKDELRPEPRLSAAARALSVYAAASGGSDAPLRVIVRLEGEPAAGVSVRSRAAAERRIALQHLQMRGQMAAAGISAVPDFDYSLLFNGMALTVRADELEKLAALPGVRSVLLARRYAAPKVRSGASADELSGALRAPEQELPGSGTVIALLDSGITPAHEAFGVYEGMLGGAKLSAAEAQARIESLGRGSYLSQKLPFAWDYADADGDVSDDAAGGAAGHGTHAAGAAAGYAPAEDGGLRFCGSAPDAQLLAMKIFSSRGDGYTDSAIWLKALEDACVLGADVVCLSLGEPSGFSGDQEMEDQLCGEILETLRQNGVLVLCPAGDEGSMAEHASNRAGPGYVSADYADYGVLASPASSGRVLAVASAEAEQLALRVLEAEGREIRFRDGSGDFFESFRAAGTAQYVVIPNSGRAEDYAGLSVRGRIALVCRGEFSDREKLRLAAEAGAAGLLLYNDAPGEFRPEFGNCPIPAAAISGEDGEYLLSLARSAAPEPEPEPGESEEDLGGVFYPVTGQNQLSPGSYLIVSETVGRAFNPSAANLNAPGNWLSVQGFQSGIPAEGQILEAVLSYDSGRLETARGFLNCSGSADDVMLLSDSGEDLQITIRADGAAEIRCRGCGFRYSETDSAFRFYRSGSPLLNDPRADVVLYRRSRVVNDPSLVGELGFPNRFVYEKNEQGGAMSPSSSMGVTPELGLKPELTGVGGSVCSAAGGTRDGYTLLSGSSVAAADAAGSLACLLRHLAQTRPELDAAARAELAEALLESSASPIWSGEGVLLSPRKQGAGRIDLEAAETARICVSEPVLSLGDSPEGRFSLRFRVRSLCQQSLSCSLSVLALRDRTVSLESLGNGGELPADGASAAYFNTLDPVDVSEQITVLGPGVIVVPAGEEVETELTLQVDEALLQTMRQELPNGGFLDGFVALRELTPPCDGGEDCPGYRFTDMPRPGSWAHPGIDFALRNGFFSGSSDTTFNPKGTMDRAMTVTVLYALAGRPAPAGESPFPDVPAGKYYTKAVTWAAENGIVAGSDDGGFHPKGSVTREQLATILLRFAQYMGLDTGARAELDGYPDLSSVHAWARSALSWAVGAGILSGVASEGETLLKPRANAARDQVATIFMRFVTKCLNPPAPTGEAHVSFTAFVGDWSAAPILEPHDWREAAALETRLSRDDPERNRGQETAAEEAPQLPAFDVNTDFSKVWLAKSAVPAEGPNGGWYLGANPQGPASYDEARACLSHSAGYDTVVAQPMLLRNARHLIMTAVDAESGALYAVTDREYLRKAFWDPALERWCSSGDFRFDGRDLEGRPLPDGTRVELRFYANLAWGEDELGGIDYEELAAAGGDWLVWRFGLTVDDAAPVFDGLRYDPGAKTLSFHVSDGQYLAYAALCRRFPQAQTPEDPLWEELFAGDRPGQGCDAVVEGVEPGEYLLKASDYAGNEIRIVLALGGDSRLCEVHFLCPEGCRAAEAEHYYATPASTLTMPELEGVPAEGEFRGWIAEPLEGIWTWEALADAALDEEVHQPGSGMEIWDESWLYVLLRTPTAYSDPGELLTQFQGESADLSGPAAFGGYDRDLEAELRLMNSSGEIWESDAPDVLRCEYPDPTTLFQLSASAGGYTIRSEEGLYLGSDREQICFLEQDELDEGCIWQIEYDRSLEMTRVYNTAAPEHYTLIYDVLSEEFRLVPAIMVNREFIWLALYRPEILEWGYFTVE